MTAPECHEIELHKAVICAHPACGWTLIPGSFTRIIVGHPFDGRPRCLLHEGMELERFIRTVREFRAAPEEFQVQALCLARPWHGRSIRLSGWVDARIDLSWLEPIRMMVNVDGVL